MNRIAVIFPGQGSQYMDMGRSLYEQYDVAKQTFEEASNVLGYDLKKICFEGTWGDLNRIDNMLPAILTTSVASYRVFLQETGKIPVYMAGHSLGEYSALVCSEAIAFEDALLIVRERSRLAMEVAESHNASMTIVEGVDLRTVQKCCSEASSLDADVLAEVACMNSSLQFAISGHSEALIKAENLLADLGAIVTPIFGGAPFHSSVMSGAAQELKGILEKHSFSAMNCNVLSNVNALPYEGSSVRDTLVNQLICPVRWSSIMEFLESQELDAIIEMGPQNLLTTLYKTEKRTQSTRTYAFNQPAERNDLINLCRSDLSLLRPAKDSTKEIIVACMAIAVSTRNQNWDDQEYQDGVLLPYRKLQLMQAEFEQSDRDFISDEVIMKSLELLDQILLTKKVTDQERIKKFEKVRSRTEARQVNDFIQRRFTNGRYASEA